MATNKTYSLLLSGNIIILLLFNGLFLHFASFCRAQNSTDSLQTVSQNALPDKQKFDMLIDLSEKFEESLPDTSIKYAKKALQLAQYLNNIQLQAQAYNSLGRLFKSQFKFSLSLNSYLQAINLLQKTGDTITLIASLNNAAFAFSKLGDFDKSLNHSFKALKLSEAIDKKTLIASTLNRIGTNYLGLHNYDKALDFLNKSLEISNNYEMPHIKIETLKSIALVYRSKNNFNKAQEYNFKSLKIAEQLNDNNNISYLFNNIGLTYVGMKDYKTAYEYYLKSLNIKKKMKDYFGMSVTYINIAEVLKRNKKFDEALEFVRKAEVLGEKMKAKYLLKNAYEVYSEIYEELNNYKNAVKYFNLARKYSDSIYSEESSKKIAEIQVSYETEKKEKEIQLLEKDNTFKELEIKQKQEERNIIVAGLLLTIILAFLLINRYQVKAKANKLLDEKNLELAQTNEVLAQKNLQISEQNKKLEELKNTQKELIAMKDKFFSIIAHDLRSPFNAILGFSSLLIDSYYNFDKTERKDILLKIKRASEETYKLLENLLEWARSQSNQIDFNPTELLLTSVVNEVLLFLSSEAKIKNINIISNINKNTKVVSDPNMLKTILRNLISNAVKYSYSGGTIKIFDKPKNNFIEICISDTGTGISKENQQKLFRTGEKYKTEGTANERGTGLGLLLCKEFVEKNNGKIWVESEENIGSLFCFTLKTA